MENRLARLSRNTGALRFFIPLGIILIVTGIFMFATAPREYGETAGTVTGVSSYMEDSTTHYNVEFDYTVDGQMYHTSFPGILERYSVGDTIPVFYDLENPKHVSNNKHAFTIGIVMIAGGAAALAYGIFATVKMAGKSKKLDQQTKAAAGTQTVPAVTAPARETMTEYYVSFDGNTFHPGYIMEDRARNVVFEAQMTKNALVGARTFTFVNRVTGETAEHEVGHTVTQGNDNAFFSTQSWFRFDGKNIWDVIHDRGIRITTDLHSRLPKVGYLISRNAQFFADVETSGKYVHEEDEAQHKMNLPVGRYFYRCWTNETDLETLFLTVFAISETEQAVVE